MRALYSFIFLPSPIVNMKEYLYQGNLILRLLCLLLIGVFLANSRATILALVFGLLQFDYIRKPKTLLIAFSIFFNHGLAVF